MSALPPCVPWPADAALEQAAGQPMVLAVHNLTASLGDTVLHMSGEVKGAAVASDSGSISFTAGDTGSGMVESSITFMLYAVIVFSMQPGFALLESGSARAQSVLMVAVKNTFDACIVALLWWVVS